MKSQLRKLLPIALMVAILVQTLAACSSKKGATSSPSETSSGSSSRTDSDTGSGGGSQASSEEAGNPYAEPVTISVANFDIPVDAESSDLFTKEGEKYYDPRWQLLAEKFNVRIEYRAYEYSIHQDQLRTMIAADDMPDAMMSTFGAAENLKYVNDGMLKVLPKGYEENYPNIKASLDMILQRDAFKTEDGRYFAIPRALEGAEPYIDYNMSIYYRKDLAQKAGVEIKDAYTVEELYNMFEKVQAANPDMIMFNHIWPDNMLQLGLIQAVPEIVAGFYLDKSTNQYVFAFQNPKMVDGIKTFKKFFNAGFIDKEFFNQPMYEARNQFSNNKLFSYFDGFDVLFYDQAVSNYKKSNPDADANAAVGFAWLLDNEGNYQGVESGNSWSEWIFNAKIEDKVLERFLAIYDYLLSEEGLYLSNLGREGIDYKIERDKIISLRQIDPETGLPVPFNTDKTVGDHLTPLINGALPDSRINYLNPKYSDEVKETVRHFWDIRKNASNLKVIEFDLAKASFVGEYYSKATLKPIEGIYKIVYEKSMDEIEAAWQKWLDENSQQINNILNELNSNLIK